MNRNLLLLPIAVVLVLFASCRGDDPTNCGPGTDGLPIGANYQDFLFRSGTYWVYQESSSGDLDSIWVSATALDTTNWVAVGGPGPCNKTTVLEEHFNMQMESSRLGNLHDWTVMQSGINWWEFSEVRVGYSGLTGDGVKLYFSARDSVERTVKGNYKPSTYYMRTDDSLVLPGGLFLDVPVFRTEWANLDFFSSPTAFDLFWSPNGIVRWDYRDEFGVLTEQWELLRWNVVR